MNDTDADLVRYKRKLILIATVGFLFRLIVGLDLYLHDPAVTNPESYTDMAQYMIFSDQFINGQFIEPIYHQPFLYLVILPVIKILFGSYPIPTIFIQSSVGALSIFLVGLIARRTFNARVGILSALFLCLSQDLVFYGAYPLPDPWLSFLFLLLLDQITEKAPIAKTLSFRMGLVIGLMTLCRGNCLLLVAPVAFVLFKKGSRRFLELTFLVLGTFLIQLPFMAWNYSLAGQFVSSVAGSNAFIYANLPSTTIFDYVERLNMGSSANSGYSPSQLFDLICAQPLSWINLKLGVLLSFFTTYLPISTNVSIKINGLNSNILSWPIFIPIPILSVLALSGMLNGENLKNSKEIFFLFASFVLFLALFIVLERYRIPVIPVYAIYSSLFCIEIWDSVFNKTKNVNKLSSLAVRFGVAYLFVFLVAAYGAT